MDAHFELRDGKAVLAALASAHPQRRDPRTVIEGASIRSRHSRHAPLGRHAGGSPVG
jgi:hypothetical protein